MAKKQYRIVTDKSLGYEVQYSYWWLPFYYQLGWGNSHSTISKAKEYIEQDKRKQTVVWKE